jgi:hypothetical protein
MELAAILRELWRWRILVAVGAAVALLAAVAVMYSITLSPPGLHARSYELGTASTRALIDTPNSQVVDLGSGETNTPANVDIGALGTRAKLLVNLMAGDALRNAIAERAGIRTRELIAFTPSAASARAPRVAAPEPSAETTGLHMLVLEADGDLPIISVDARAPSAEQAQKLAAAAVPALRDHVAQVAKEQGVPDVQQLVVQQLNPPRGSTISGGPKRLTALLVFVVVLGFACLAILVVSSVVRGWRQVIAAELAADERWWRPGADEMDELVDRDDVHGSAPRDEPEREYAQ